MRTVFLTLVLIVATGFAGLGVGLLLAQQPRQPPQDEAAQPRIDVFERFRGIVNLRAPNGSARAAQVTVHNWGIPNGQTISSFPLQGFLVMELRGGEVTTVINGERAEREAGSFWVVTERVSFSLITGNDTAALQVTAIQPAPSR